jgi:hypothetical protein
VVIATLLAIGGIARLSTPPPSDPTVFPVGDATHSGMTVQPVAAGQCLLVTEGLNLGISVPVPCTSTHQVEVIALSNSTGPTSPQRRQAVCQRAAHSALTRDALRSVVIRDIPTDVGGVVCLATPPAGGILSSPLGRRTGR